MIFRIRLSLELGASSSIPQLLETSSVILSTAYSVQEPALSEVARTSRIESFLSRVNQECSQAPEKRLEAVIQELLKEEAYKHDAVLQEVFLGSLPAHLAFQHYLREASAPHLSAVQSQRLSLEFARALVRESSGFVGEVKNISLGLSAEHLSPLLNRLWDWTCGIEELGQGNWRAWERRGQRSDWNEAYLSVAAAIVGETQQSPALSNELRQEIADAAGRQELGQILRSYSLVGVRHGGELLSPALGMVAALGGGWVGACCKRPIASALIGGAVNGMIQTGGQTLWNIHNPQAPGFSESLFQFVQSGVTGAACGLMGHGAAWLVSGASGLGKLGKLNELGMREFRSGILLLCGNQFKFWADVLTEVFLDEGWKFLGGNRNIQNRLGLNRSASASPGRAISLDPSWFYRIVNNAAGEIFGDRFGELAHHQAGHWGIHFDLHLQQSHLLEAFGGFYRQLHLPDTVEGLANNRAALSFTAFLSAYQQVGGSAESLRPYFHASLHAEIHEAIQKLGLDPQSSLGQEAAGHLMIQYLGRNLFLSTGSQISIQKIGLHLKRSLNSLCPPSVPENLATQMLFELLRRYDPQEQQRWLLDAQESLETEEKDNALLPQASPAFMLGLSHFVLPSFDFHALFSGHSFHLESVVGAVSSSAHLWTSLLALVFAPLVVLTFRGRKSFEEMKRQLDTTRIFDAAALETFVTDVRVMQNERGRRTVDQYDLLLQAAAKAGPEDLPILISAIEQQMAVRKPVDLSEMRKTEAQEGLAYYVASAPVKNRSSSMEHPPFLEQIQRSDAHCANALLALASLDLLLKPSTPLNRKTIEAVFSLIHKILPRLNCRHPQVGRIFLRLFQHSDIQAYINVNESPLVFNTLLRCIPFCDLVVSRPIFPVLIRFLSLKSNASTLCSFIETLSDLPLRADEKIKLYRCFVEHYSGEDSRVMKYLYHKVLGSFEELLEEEGLRGRGVAAAKNLALTIARLSPACENVPVFTFFTVIGLLLTFTNLAEAKPLLEQVHSSPLLGGVLIAVSGVSVALAAGVSFLRRRRMSRHNRDLQLLNDSQVSETSAPLTSESSPVVEELSEDLPEALSDLFLTLRTRSRAEDIYPTLLAFVLRHPQDFPRLRKEILRNYPELFPAISDRSELCMELLKQVQEDEYVYHHHGKGSTSSVGFLSLHVLFAEIFQNYHEFSLTGINELVYPILCDEFFCLLESTKNEEDLENIRSLYANFLKGLSLPFFSMISPELLTLILKKNQTEGHRNYFLSCYALFIERSFAYVQEKGVASFKDLRIDLETLRKQINKLHPLENRKDGIACLKRAQELLSFLDPDTTQRRAAIRCSFLLPFSFLSGIHFNEVAHFSWHQILLTLGCGALALFVTAQKKPRPSPEKKVAILGGGMAGLFAALHLVEQGAEAVDITILEAQAQEWGGKAASRNEGAQLLDDVEANPLLDFARAHRIELIEADDYDRVPYLLSDGRTLDADTFYSALTTLREEAARSLENESFDTLDRKTPEEWVSALFSLSEDQKEALLGHLRIKEGAGNISALSLCFNLSKNRGLKRRFEVRGGVSALVEGLKTFLEERGVHFVLNSKVREIVHEGNQVRVEVAGQAKRMLDAVIVAVAPEHFQPDQNQRPSLKIAGTEAPWERLSGLRPAVLHKATLQTTENLGTKSGEASAHWAFWKANQGEQISIFHGLEGDQTLSAAELQRLVYGHPTEQIKVSDRAWDGSVSREGVAHAFSTPPQPGHALGIVKLALRLTLGMYNSGRIFFANHVLGLGLRTHHAAQSGINMAEQCLVALGIKETASLPFTPPQFFGISRARYEQLLRQGLMEDGQERSPLQEHFTWGPHQSVEEFLQLVETQIRRQRPDWDGDFWEANLGMDLQFHLPPDLYLRVLDDFHQQVDQVLKSNRARIGQLLKIQEGLEKGLELTRTQEEQLLHFKRICEKDIERYRQKNNFLAWFLSMAGQEKTAHCTSHSSLKIYRKISELRDVIDALLVSRADQESRQVLEALRQGGSTDLSCALSNSVYASQQDVTMIHLSDTVSLSSFAFKKGKAPFRFLTDVLTNLLTNVGRYGGSSDAEIYNQWIEGEGLQLTVSDQGIGIEAANLHRLGEHSFREERQRVEGSNGHGLSSVMTVLQQMGWSPLVVKSVVDQGSHFRFVIPAEQLFFQRRSGETNAKSKRQKFSLRSFVKRIEEEGFTIPDVARRLWHLS
ncbi:MAG: FAD-dependent oxidoreductase [Deltaproteobacteria bacterium]|nr:FAD-dependent oxidoreductase [Deltaproteobacteria bacterium]